MEACAGSCGLHMLVRCGASHAARGSWVSALEAGDEDPGKCFRLNVRLISLDRPHRFQEQLACIHYPHTQWRGLGTGMYLGQDTLL